MRIHSQYFQRIAWLIVAILAVALGVHHAIVRPIVVDEWEHVHSAFLVSKGQLPYRDFWQNHPPLGYLLTGWLVPFSDPSFSTIIAVRLTSLLARLGAVVLAVGWTRQRFGPRDSAVVAVFLLADTFLFDQGSLLYLDTFVAPMLVGSAWALSASSGRPRRAVLAGALLAASTLFTQKAFAQVGVAVLWYLWRLWQRRADRPAQRKVIGEAAGYVAGGLAVLAVVLLPFLPRGLGPLWRDAVVFNASWKGRFFQTSDLRNMIIDGGLVYAFAAIGIVFRAVEFLRHRRADARDVPLACLVVSLAAIPLVPDVYSEYFIGTITFAGIVAANVVTRWWSAINPTAVHRRSNRFLLWRTATPLPMACLLALPGITAIGNIERKYDNSTDRRHLASVMRLSDSSESVFDAYGGYGVFRPHAYRFWVLHDRIQAQLTPKQLGPDLLAALERNRPKLAIVDSWARTLPAEVQRYLERNYEPSDDPAIWVRRT